MTTPPKTIAETLEAYRAKTLKPSEVAEFFISRIREHDKEIGAYLRVYEKEVREAAAKADAAYTNGTPRPLEGIFIGMKDNIVVSGTETTASSKMLEGYVAPYTATAAEKLFRAGAIMVGKTNMDEFAMGSSTENSAYQKTKNPVDPTRVPGGSSGGSAAAVAGGFCHAALGSDTGGSIRQPASLCGAVGFKPTYGSVSRYGLLAMASSLDVIGPLTHTVGDSKIIFDVIRGKDAKDGTTVDIDENSQRGDGKTLKGIRVGVPKEYFLPGMEQGVEESVTKALEKLESLGAELVAISLPHAEYGLATYYVIMPAEVSTNLSRFDGVRFPSSSMSKAKSLEEGYVASRGKFGPEAQRRILIGAYVLSSGYYDAYYRQAQKARTLVTRDFTDAFTKVDVIVSPTSPTVAWKIGEKTNDPLAMYLSDIFTVTTNLAGIPAISVPCGTVDGLPVGLQLMAPKGKDLFLLDVAEAFEKSNT